MPAKFVSNRGLRNLLAKASDDERLAMTKILSPGAKLPMDATVLQEEICLAGGHKFINWVRRQGTGYIDIVDDVVEALKIKGLPGYDKPARKQKNKKRIIEGLTLREIDEIESVRDLKTSKKLGLEYLEMAEKVILLKILRSTYKKLDKDQRRKFDKNINDVARQFGNKDTSGKLAGGAGLLIVGNLGGFATYTLMSSVLSTISLGTLGFGAYTAASSALSVILGPVGWVALGAAGIYALGKPELKKTIPLVAMIGMIRQRISHTNGVA